MLIAMKGAGERLCGLLLLGDKLSEEAYAPGDRELLQAIANQAAIVWENLWLKDNMRREQQIRREVLAHLDSRGINLLKECPQCGKCFDRDDEHCSEDRTPLLLTVPVDRRVDGRYRLERRLGRGAMGVVFEAFDERLRRDVAVKVLHGGLFGAQEALRRFEREAQTSSRLTHAHIVRTYDFGTVGTDGAYLVLELLRGMTWREELRRRGPFPPHVAATRLQQLLDGLHAAHEIGLVHRDLKPENLMLCAGPHGDDVIKILDFGLAKNVLLDGDTQFTGAVLSAPGAVIGTYAYMAPEQLSGHPVDARTDLFAVGVITVECLTGRRPFGGSVLSELVRSVLHDSFHLRGANDDVRQLDACLQMALAKDPDSRYPSAAAMRAQIVPAIAGCTSLRAIPTAEELAAPTERPDGSHLVE
jgi:serine/threonine protein kinase